MSCWKIAWLFILSNCFESIRLDLGIWMFVNNIQLLKLGSMTQLKMYIIKHYFFLKDSKLKKWKQKMNDNLNDLFGFKIELFGPIST